MNPKPSFNATAIILAGGKSSRMGGKDKAMLPVSGIPMIQYIANQLSGSFNQILIGAGEKENFAFLGYPVIPDLEKDKGPLMGLMSCLNASPSEINFITACDIPVINLDLVAKMILLAEDNSIVMPRHGGDKYEPLFAVYRRSVAETAKEVLAKGKRRIIDLLPLTDAKFVEFGETDWYKNLNYQSDYRDFLKK